MDDPFGTGVENPNSIILSLSFPLSLYPQYLPSMDVPFGTDIENPDSISPSLSDMSLMDDPFQSDVEKFFPETKPWRNAGPYTWIKSEQEYEAAITTGEPIVCHFSEKNSEYCACMDLVLSNLSEAHPETRFLKISAEENPGLAARLNISKIPTIALIRNGEVGGLVVVPDILDILVVSEDIESVMEEKFAGYITVATKSAGDQVGWDDGYLEW